MNLYQTVQERLIRFCVHPFHKPEAISYQTAFQKARSAIVVCPDAVLLESIHEKMNKTFSRMKITYVIPLFRSQVPPATRIKAPVYFIPHYSLFKIGRNEHYNTLKNQPFDILLDLTREPFVLSFLLARRRVAGLAIGLKKDYSQYYYNLQYAVDPEQPPEKQLTAIFKFIEKIIPGK